MSLSLSSDTVIEAYHHLHTIADYVRWTITTFEHAELEYGHGSSNSIDETLQLLAATLGLTLPIPSELWSATLTPSEKKTYLKRVQARINKRIPVAYLTEMAWFCKRPYFVNRSVLIPRSPLGEVIEQVLPARFAVAPELILDLGTGCGCLAITAAYQFPSAQVDAVDISPDALTVAEENITAHGLADRVFPICSDLFEALSISNQYDLILSNPPYVPESIASNLPKEYLHEPQLALAAGPDGLLCLRKILQRAHQYLKPNGILVAEVGDNQTALCAAFPNIPFEWVTLNRGGSGVFILTQKQLSLLIEGEAFHSEISMNER